MKGNALRKDFIVELKKTWNRFFSILLIVALGVAFFSGIRATSPDMNLSADLFYDNSNFMDIRVISTLGLTQEDVDAIEEVAGVKRAAGAYSYDVFCNMEEAKAAVRLFSQLDSMNEVNIKEGRLPQKADECLVDTKFLDGTGYKIGDTVKLSADAEEDLDDILSGDTYRIVGSGSIPQYLSLDRGTTKIGSGSLHSFIILPKESFALSAFTEVDLTVTGAKELLDTSVEYEDIIENVKDKLDEIAKERGESRYQSVYQEGEQELTDARSELAEKQQELDDAREQLADGEEKISDGWASIADNETKLENGKKEIAGSEKKLREGKAQLADGYAQLVDGKNQLNDSKTLIEDARAQFAAGQAELFSKQQELNSGKDQIAKGYQTLGEKEEELKRAKEELDGFAAGESTIEVSLIQAEEQLRANKQQLDAAKAQLDANAEQMEAVRVQIQELEPQIKQLDALVEAGVITQEEADAQRDIYYEAVKSVAEYDAAVDLYHNNVQQYEAGRKEFEEKSQQFAEGKEQYKEGLFQYQAGIEQIRQARMELDETRKEMSDAQQQLDAGFAELEEKRGELEEGQSQLELGKQDILKNEALLDENSLELSDGEAQLADAWKQYQSGKVELEQGKKELTEKEAEFNESKQDYEEAKAKADPLIADAQIQIKDGQEKLDKLEAPQWYILDRNTIQTYVEYGQDSQRIEAIGKVFPAIFFLVAALICLTTMTRMVEEERIQIGTLKALGYGKLAIAGKYICYAFFASLIGSLIGLVVGQKLLPVVIIKAYGILYNNLPEVVAPLHLNYSISSTGLAIFCTVTAVVFACYKELMAVPANLMRPVAPKNGKRVLLERIGFIWNHINFTNKSTIRNLFRYKKRFFMTVLGIGGCMGLLLVGFGVKDSIRSIGSMQFGNIRTYDGEISLEEDSLAEEKEDIWKKLSTDSEIKEYLPVYETSITAGNNKIEKSAYMVIPKEPDEIQDFISLHNRVTKESYVLDDSGLILSEKLAKLLGVKEGDTITLKEDETNQITAIVSHITENYFNHYIYMSPDFYEKLYGEKPDYLKIYTINQSKTTKFEEALQSKYMQEDQVTEVSFITKTSDRISDMLKSMDTIIYVLVISAGLLAFIVLYNLNNINMSERKRELATLKVLGFYDLEVSAYVLRENIWLTAIGSLVGIVFGKILHYFVILTAEIDIMMFGRSIDWKSYLYSIGLTFIFSLLVNFTMHFKLKKISMVESMKSVE